MVTALQLGAAVAGASAGPVVRGSDHGIESFVPANHIGAPTLAGIRRVVMLPIWAGPSVSGESVAEFDPVLLAALRRQNRFEVVALGREECKARYRTDALASFAALPADLLPRLRREFAADAVLFVDLIAYSAYPPLAVGFRAKLATIEDPWIVWAFDELFCADVPEVAAGARRYLAAPARGMPEGASPPLHSPSRFTAYAAATMFATLPPVWNAPRPAGRPTAPRRR